MAIIYKITNKQNNKVYIGQTIRTLEERLYNKRSGHFVRAYHYNTGGALYAALRKYGKDGFTYEVIEEKDNDDFDSKEDLHVWLNSRETYWISFYNSIDTCIGYNRTTGGQKNFRMSEESSRKAWQTRRANGTDKLTNEQKLRCRQRMKRRWQEDITYRNRQLHILHEANRNREYAPFTEEHRQKISNAHKGLSYNKGRKYVNDGTKTKFILPEEIDHYLSLGWKLGRGRVKW